MSDHEPFDPQARLITLPGKAGGAAYLQVKDRLLWARDEHPNLCVETRVIQLTEKIAVFRAEVAYLLEPSELGGERTYVVGTGHGSETPQGFPAGYIEKAETVAIGRALGALGYGTAAAFEDEGRLADAPIAQHAQVSGNREVIPSVGIPNLISPRQDGFIRTLMKDHGVSDELMHTMIQADYGVAHLRELTKQQASSFISALQGLPMAEEQGVTQEPQTGYEMNQQGYEVPEEPAHVSGSIDRWTN